MTNNLLRNFYYLLTANKQKALVGFFVSTLLSGLAQVGLSGNMTLNEALTSLGIGIVTHASVYLKKNVG